MIKIKIKKANHEYSHDLWEWRNDRLTRKMSKNSNYITWENHKKWFSKVIIDPDIFFYVGEIENKIMGSVRFAKHSKSLDDYFVNINISPNNRGRGLSKLLLNSSINKFSSEVNKIRFLKAEVKEINNISKKLFKNYGFEEENSSKNKIITYKLYMDKN
tara:strand:- start:10 stop:486 length:477 start_codon:yes stop_codon:yes gene_type:complete